MKKELSCNLEKLATFDVMISKVTKKLGWVFDDEECVFIDSSSKVVNWDEFDSLTLEEGVIDDNNDNYKQINVWGDGTMEFQNTEGESICWDEFSIDFLKRISELV